MRLKVAALLGTQHVAGMKVTLSVFSTGYMVLKKKFSNVPVCFHSHPSDSSPKGQMALMTMCWGGHRAGAVERTWVKVSWSCSQNLMGLGDLCFSSG